MIDLHIHSICSDGTFSTKEIVELANGLNLSTIAITDHDTVDGIALAQKTALEYNIDIINGVELSADYNGCEIHILGYFLDIKNKNLLNFLSDLKITRDKRNKSLIEALNDKGIDISLDYVANFSGGNLITKAHFGKAIMEKGYTKTIQDSFKLYLGRNRIGDVKRDLIPYNDAISIIKKSGGVSSLAHPTKYGLSTNEIISLIKTLKQSGLQAVECYYSSHTKKEVNLLLKICKEYNLCQTSGSDFHGNNRPYVSLGNILYGNKLSEQIASNILNNLKLCKGE